MLLIFPPSGPRGQPPLPPSSRFAFNWFVCVVVWHKDYFRHGCEDFGIKKEDLDGEFCTAMRTIDTLTHCSTLVRFAPFVLGNRWVESIGAGQMGRRARFLQKASCLGMKQTRVVAFKSAGEDLPRNCSSVSDMGNHISLSSAERALVCPGLGFQSFKRQGSWLRTTTCGCRPSRGCCDQSIPKAPFFLGGGTVLGYSHLNFCDCASWINRSARAFHAFREGS